MNRRDLVQKVILGSTALIVIPSALTSCEKDSDPDPPPVINPGSKITIDLTLPANSALNNEGGSIIVQSIIVANTGNMTFVALDSACTHTGCTVDYNLAGGKFICPCHQSEYSTTGAVLAGPAPTALKSYPVSKAGDILTISV